MGSGDWAKLSILMGIIGSSPFWITKGGHSETIPALIPGSDLSYKAFSGRDSKFNRKVSDLVDSLVGKVKKMCRVKSYLAAHLLIQGTLATFAKQDSYMGSVWAGKKLEHPDS
jgi:hypothetical protein